LQGSKPEKLTGREREPSPIAAMRPATASFLHRGDERHLNRERTSMRQKTHLGASGNERGYRTRTETRKSANTNRPGRHPQSRQRARAVRNCSTGCKRRVAHPLDSIVRQFGRRFGGTPCAVQQRLDIVANHARLQRPTLLRCTAAEELL